MLIPLFAVLPNGEILKSVHSHGQSAWSYTVKIDTLTSHGTSTAYFAKVQYPMASLSCLLKVLNQPFAAFSMGLAADESSLSMSPVISENTSSRASTSA